MNDNTFCLSNMEENDQQHSGQGLPAPVCSLPIVEALNRLPEVTWDRWSGDGIENASVFGWIPRRDGRFDFVYVMIDKEGPWLVSTSSAQYSSEFSRRLLGGHPDASGHNPCKRVEHYFPDVNCVRLSAENDQGMATQPAPQTPEKHK